MSSPKRILHVVTNVSKYENEPDQPTGLWLSELTHAWDVFQEHGYTQTLVSPLGGAVPLEPKSLGFPSYDASSKAWKESSERMALLEKTAKPADVNAADFDAIYFTGGHAVMFDFPDNEGLQKLTREIYERGGVVSSVCHGFCGLLNTKLSNGEYLIKGKKLSGFSWNEEVLAGVSKHVPYNAEEKAREHGAEYTKALLPFVSNVVVDENLITGQNPGSASDTAKKIVTALGGNAS